MAGKKQHDNPCFLLKGFESRPRRKGKPILTWYFLKSSVPKEVSIRDIGHSNLFYGSPGPESLDARITNKEGDKYSVTVDRVREDKEIRSSDKDTLVEFVYFQGIR